MTHPRDTMRCLWNSGTQNSQTIVIVTYLLLNPWITCSYAAGTSQMGEPAGLLSEERVLRDFVQYVQQDHGVLCSPTFAFAKPNHRQQPPSRPPAHANPASPVDLAVTFHPVFSKIFTPEDLTHTYLSDVRNAVQTARILHRFPPQTSNEAAVRVNELLLQSFLKQSGSTVTWERAEVKVQLGQNNNNNNNEVTQKIDNANQTFSLSLLGIAMCEQSQLLGYVNRLDSSHGSGPASGRSKICAESGNLIVPQHNRFTFTDSEKQDRFSVIWLANQCDSLPGQLSIIRLSVQPRESPRKLHFLFEFDARNITINQCALGIHQCAVTTKCEYKRYSDWAFAMDNYLCACDDGFYVENAENGFPAPYIREKFTDSSNEMGTQFHCRPCPVGYSHCGKDRLHRVRLDLNLLRAIPLAVQSFCITACVVIGIALCRLRKARVVKAANWLLLEILLIGAILLYLIIVVMYFPASDVTCILSPWLRELGFAVMYGVLIVKIYRVLSGFQSRKAHRVHVRDKDILKFLGIFIITTFTYMVAWTAINLDYISSTPWSRNPAGSAPVSMLLRGSFVQSQPADSIGHNWTGSGNESFAARNAASTDQPVNPASLVTFDVCRSLSWDVVMELAEFIILAVSIHYCRLVRTAPTEYNETMYISVALIVEMTVSGIFNLIRHFIWYTVHPDYVFLLYFLRSHITVTVNLVLIFGPKAWFLYRPINTVAGASRGRTTPGAPYSADPNLASTGKLNLALNGDLDIADVNLADMDPEVIRRELKRLCTQIELYKTKAMRKDNPHISKRRGGRKQRRFSLQPFYKRHHGQSGNVPLMIQTDSGYCWADCRSRTGAATTPSAGTKHDHQSTHSGRSGSSSTVGGGGSRVGSYYAYPSVVHDEEVSKLSEESTNSVEDTPVSANAPAAASPPPQQQQLLCSSSSAASGKSGKRTKRGSKSTETDATRASDKTNASDLRPG